MAGGSEQGNLEATFLDLYQIMSSPLSSTHVTGTGRTSGLSSYIVLSEYWADGCR